MSELTTAEEDFGKYRSYVIAILQEIMDRAKCTQESADGQLAYVDGLASSALVKLVILNDRRSPFCGMVVEEGAQ